MSLEATPLPFVPAAKPAAQTRGASTNRADDGFEALVDKAKRERAAADKSAEAKLNEPEPAKAIPTSEITLTDAKSEPSKGAETGVEGIAFVAELNVEATARPANGPVTVEPASEEIPDPEGAAVVKSAEVTDQDQAGLTGNRVKADPDLALAATSDEDSAVKAPGTGDKAGDNPKANPLLQPVDKRASTPVEGDAEIPPASAAPKTPSGDAPTPSGDAALTAREARAADALQRAADAKAAKAGAEVNPNPQNTAKGEPGAKAGGEARADVTLPKAAAGKTDQPAKAETAPTDGEPLDGEVLAPLKEGRPASERAPGELLRGDIQKARRASATGADAAAARAERADARSGAASATPAEPKPAGQPAQPAAPAMAPPGLPGVLTATPAFEVLLAQMNFAADGQAMLDDGPMDPALSKSDAAFDPSGVRMDARAEVRTASTLQFAQGPRMTPQSAQTMAAQIAQRFNEGSRVFDIRMDPPELGRVEVRMEVSSDNSVRAVLSAERAETLAELQRHARELERALSEAGLDVGEDALSFSLSDDSEHAGESRDDTGPDLPVFADTDAGADALSAPLAPVSTYGFLLARAEGLDVSV